MNGILTRMDKHSDIYLERKIINLKRIRKNKYTCETDAKYEYVQKIIKNMQQELNRRKLLQLIGG